MEYGALGGYESFLGIPVTLASYASILFPILISMPIVKLINDLAKKISPNMLSTLLIPIITVIIAVPVILIVTGPIATWITNILLTVVDFLFVRLSVVGGLIIGAFVPYTVILGIHAGITVPIALAELTEKGFTLLFPLLCYANLSIGDRHLAYS